MSRVRVDEGEEAGEFPIGGYTEARIALRDGGEYVIRVDVPRGDPSRPLAWEELAAKFRDCAGGVLSAEATEGSLDLVRRLEELDSVRGLTEALSG